jgi:tetratricopeptide (TPR) repeat protein
VCNDHTAASILTLPPRAAVARQVCCLVASLGLLAGLSTPVPAEAGQGFVSPAARQLVVPFDNESGSARVYWLAEASAVLLTDDLTALGATVLSREERLLAFEQLSVPPFAALSHATVIRIGGLVGATQVVVGRYVLTGNTLTVRARAIRLDSGRLLPEVIESAPLGDVFQIYDRIARRLLPEATTTPEMLQQGRPTLPAFEQYVKGLLAQSPSTQIWFFTEALRLSPDFHRARLGLWSAHTAQGEYQRAYNAVRPIPGTDRRWRRARFLASLSMLDLAQYGAAADALSELNQQRPDAALANNLGVVQLRRPPGATLVKASSFFAEAARLDPTDASVFFNLGYAHWLERDIPSAVAALREVVRRDPADGDAHFVLGVALQAAGSPVEAGREKELARQLSSTYADWEARPGGANSLPRRLERVKTDLDVPAALRVNDVIVSAGQRDQQELAVFHLESGKRLFQGERDVEAIAELRRAVYLAPYQSEAHLMLGRAYLRTGRPALAISALKISIWSADTDVARLTLATAYLETKDSAAARSEVQAVLRRNPGSVEAQRLLERLPAN